jgi:hypothetical protein
MLDALLILSVIILILILSIDDLTQTQKYIKYCLIILVIYLTVNTQTKWVCGGGSRFKDVQYYKNIINGVLLNNTESHLALRHVTIMPSVQTVTNLTDYLEQCILNIEHNKNSKDPNYYVYKDILIYFNKLNNIGNGFFDAFKGSEHLSVDQLNETKHLIGKLRCLLNLWK